MEKKPDASEYLSGFYREDRLIPIITLVLYFSPGEWDRPMSLHEMLAVQDPEILSFVSDYKLNLIAPGQMTDAEIDRFNTSLREVMLFIKYSEDRAKLNEMVEKDDRIKNIDRKAATVISTVIGIEIENEIIGNGTILITNNFVAQWNVTLDDIDIIATRNTETKLKPTVNNINEILKKQFTCMFEDLKKEEEIPEELQLPDFDFYFFLNL